MGFGPCKVFVGWAPSAWTHRLSFGRSKYRQHYPRSVQRAVVETDSLVGLGRVKGVGPQKDRLIGLLLPIPVFAPFLCTSFGHVNDC